MAEMAEQSNVSPPSPPNCPYERDTNDLTPEAKEEFDKELMAWLEPREVRIIHHLTFFRQDGFHEVAGPYYADEIRPFKNNHDFGHITLKPPSSPPLKGLGKLEVLPTEMILEVISQMSVEGVLRFQHTNRKARELVYRSTHFRTVMEHAQDVVKVVLKTNIADTVRFANIYAALCSVGCDKCGLLGQYLYLPSMSRCCLDCLHHDPDFRTVALTAFAKEHKVSVKKLRNLVTVIRGIPRRRGGYAWGEVDCTGRTNFVNFPEAKKAVEKLTGRVIPDTEPQTKQPYVVSCPLPLYDKEEDDTFLPLSCLGCYSLIDRDYRAMLALKEYTAEEFIEHFLQCKEAQRFWRMTEDGKKPIWHIWTESRMVQRQGRIREWVDGQWEMPS